MKSLQLWSLLHEETFHSDSSSPAVHIDGFMKSFLQPIDWAEKT